MYPENYLTMRWQRMSSATIATEYASMAQLISRADGTTDANAQSQAKLLEIEQHLARAHELYLQRRYDDAIGEYKRTQTLVYQLLHPAFPQPLGQRPEVVFPLRPELFEPLLKASLSIVEGLDPRIIETTYAPAVDVPEDLLEPLIKYADLGIDVVDAVPRSVRLDSQLGNAYAARGQWNQAEFFFRRADTQLGDPQTDETKAAKAALGLNLGGVLLQTDRADEAKTLLKSSLDAFEQAGDQVGMAQANLNLAAVSNRMGDSAAATGFLKKASEFLDAAQGITTQAVHAGGGGELLQALDAQSIGHLAASRTFNNELIAAQPTFARLADVQMVERTVVDNGSTNPATLETLTTAAGQGITLRETMRGGGWTNLAVETPAETKELDFTKELRFLVGEQLVPVQWPNRQEIPHASIIDAIYSQRINLTDVLGVAWRHELPSDFGVKVPHTYFYIIPVALGDCYYAIGEYETAESYYLQAADYQYINTALEVPALWRKLAENALAWGDQLYRADNLADPLADNFANALAVYRKVLEPPGGAAAVDINAPLYSHPKLKLTGAVVVAMLADLDTVTTNGTNPTLAAPVLAIRARLIQISAGLNFLGLPTDSVPIWSFDFLQNVARYFAQQAVQSEREYINWLDRSEKEDLTRQQLQQAVAQAGAERELARQQREAAETERSVYQAGSALASTRRANSQQNRNDYAAMSWERIWLSKNNAWYSAQNPWELDNPVPGTGQVVNVPWVFGGTIAVETNRKHIHEIIAENTQRLETITRDYELASMARQTAELQQAEVMAQRQVAAAQARVEAAAQMEQVAALHAAAAQENLSAFNSSFFTPEVWYQMAAFMRSISDNYLHMALRVAWLMQKAYNFENDLERRFIKIDYSTNTVKGLLAADALLLDIDSFTYDLITTIRRKQVPIKQTISLAARYPFLFETQFRQSGKLEFETRIEDFDMAHPGTYGQRIERVEVEIEGVVPSAGVRGTLTCSGLSRYRTADINLIKFRIQSRDTLVLSEYRLKDDAFVFTADPRALGVLEGAGVVGSWLLDIPGATNDLDFSSITDIRLTFYYNARYDPLLADAVKNQIAAFAALNFRPRAIPLRWMFPDAFFAFQDNGQLRFSLGALDFPFNELNPQIRRLSLLVLTMPGTDPSGWNVRLGVPGHPATIAATPNAQGEITVAAGDPWEALQNGPAQGNYLIEIRPDENPDLVVAGKLNLEAISNFVLITEYEFTPRI